MIGPGWLSSADKDGSRRLDNPDDFVRIELASALARDIPVIPVLVDGADMPPAEAVPDLLKGLARRHANPWGLNQVHGNVWEWTEDCWIDNNQGNPGNGSARTTGDCSRRVVRSGSWYNDPR